jgi:hypothetical protein
VIQIRITRFQPVERAIDQRLAAVRADQEDNL